MVLSDWATGGDDAEISPFELLFYSESSNTRIELNSILLKQPIKKIACTSSSQLEIEARNIVWESSPSVSSSNSAIWQDYLWFSELAEALVPDCSKPYPTAFRHHQPVCKIICWLCRKWHQSNQIKFMIAHQASEGKPHPETLSSKVWKTRVESQTREVQIEFVFACLWTQKTSFLYSSTPALFPAQQNYTSTVPQCL